VTVHDTVKVAHALDAAASTVRTVARLDRSEPLHEFALVLSGLCAQITAVATTEGHSGLLAGEDRPSASLDGEMRTAARLLSDLPCPASVQARTWATLVLRVQTAARDAMFVPGLPVGRS
jgi:hypothetical protein